MIIKNKFLHWAPRILSLLFVGFLSIFSLDVFSEYSGLSVILPLFVHLLIPLIVLIAILIAWKRDLVGMAIFLFFAGYYVYMVGPDRHWSLYASISGPALLISILYLLNWLSRKEKINHYEK